MRDTSPEMEEIRELLRDSQRGSRQKMITARYHGTELASKAPNERLLTLYARPFAPPLDAKLKAADKKGGFDAVAELMQDPASFGGATGACCAPQVGALEVQTSATDGFHVLIDGVVFGPFHKIRVQPTEIVLPTMTYFPLDET